MHIHILGICGTFMGGLAALAVQAGHRVTGCDASVYPPMSTQLAGMGIDLIDGYGADQVALQPDLYVIGNVVSRGNPLMEKILDMGLPYVSGPEWIGNNILSQNWVLAVAGTHGKTTTSSMLAWILDQSGYNPGFLIGGVPLDFGVSARLGNCGEKGGFFVIEADEYDTAFFDKRSKFVHYRPQTAILNNLEYDHADIFPDLAAIETQFHHLVRTVPGVGRLIVNRDEPALQRVLQRGCWSEVDYFGAAKGDGWASEGPSDASFSVLFHGQEVGQINWGLTGMHNRQNAIAAIAAARHVGVVPEQAIEALGRFRSVKRRMEKRGEAGGVAVYDDFAHHPTAIKSTLAGARNQLPQNGGRLIAVLEPRSNTMKLGTMRDELPGSLADADVVFGYGSTELGWDLGEALAPLGDKATAMQDIDTLVERVVKTVRSGDQVIVMSNGGFGGVHDKLLSALREREGAAATV